MSYIKSISSFLLFMVALFSALALRFQFGLYQNGLTERTIIILIVVLISSGIGLGLCVFFSSAKIESRLKLIGLGVGFTGFLFFGILATETYLSKVRYSRRSTPEAFSDLTDHCGVSSGRAVLKLIHSNFSSPQLGALREFQIKNYCRLRHFNELLQNENLICSSKEDPIECRLRWMTAFSEHGYWNFQSRKFFFDEVMKRWSESRKEEPLIDFVLKDQELELGRQTILKEAGLEEALEDRYILIHQEDELANLKLTEKIFIDVARLIVDSEKSPPPYLLKFKEVRSEIQARLVKIPEVEKDVERLRLSNQR